MQPPDSRNPSAPLLALRYASLAELVAKITLLGAPALYVLGRVYADSYWTALSIPPSVMRQSGEDYIFLGFIALVSGLISVLPRADSVAVWLAPLLSLALLLALAVGVWLLRRAHDWLVSKIRGLAAPIRHHLSSRREQIEALSTASKIVDGLANLAMAFLIVSILLITPIVMTHAAGKREAEALVERLRDAPSKGIEVSLRSNETWRGHAIECGPRYCVVYSGGAFSVAPESDVIWEPRRALRAQLNKES